MSSFDRVTKIWRALKYMDEARGQYLRELIRQHKSSDILELGFFQGKSSAYLAAILEDEGRGHLTTIDVARARAHRPARDVRVVIDDEQARLHLVRDVGQLLRRGVMGAAELLPRATCCRSRPADRLRG